MLLELAVIPHMSFDLLSEINIYGIVYRFTVCSSKSILKKKIYYPPLLLLHEIHKNLKKNHSILNETLIVQYISIRNKRIIFNFEIGFSVEKNIFVSRSASIRNCSETVPSRCRERDEGVGGGEQDPLGSRGSSRSRDREVALTVPYVSLTSLLPPVSTLTRA